MSVRNVKVLLLVERHLINKKDSNRSSFCSCLVTSMVEWKNSKFALCVVVMESSLTYQLP